MLTVYFDTSFYVNLCRAEEADAAEVIEALKSLGVRLVCSHEILSELLSHVGNRAGDLRLLGLLNDLPCLELDGARWQVLALSDEERVAMRDKLAGMRPVVDMGTSFGLVAETLGSTDLDGMIEANREGFVEFGILNADEAVDGPSAMHGLLDSLQEVAPQQLVHVFAAVVTSIDELYAAPEDERPRLQAEVQARVEAILASLAEIAPEVFAADEARKDIMRGDPRPRAIVMGQDTEKHLQRVSNSYRDAGHIGRFVAHSDGIALLQLDGPQYRKLVAGSSSESLLARRNLLHRCFHLPNVQDVADVLEQAAAGLPEEEQNEHAPAAKTPPNPWDPRGG